jgi:molybdopterin-guanine dinucleotide biosynthesis protein A
VIDALNPCVDELIISGEKDLTQFGYPVIEDQICDIGPLAGFHAGFSLISSPYTFVTGCDTPFISSEIVSLLFEECTGYSCCVPQNGSYIEPLCSVYHTRETHLCSTHIIQGGKNRIWDLIHSLSNPHFIPWNVLTSVDPHLFCFQNINNPADLDLAERIMKENYT